MASTIRQYTDFTQFGGSINNDGIYSFPTMTYTDTKQHTRKWTIFIRLVKNKTIEGINWVPLTRDIIPILPSYLTGSKPLPANIWAQVWVESGIDGGKLTRSAPSYPNPTNIGRANERNNLQQALVLARSRYLKQCDKCKCDINEPSSSIAVAGIRYFPMLARKYEEEKKRRIRLGDDIFAAGEVLVQPKLDGMRCVIYLNGSSSNPTSKDVILYTRMLKDIVGFSKLQAELFKPLRELLIDGNESLYLDGEFYIHDRPLQSIVGEVRNAEQSDIQFYIFDAFYPSQTNMGYSDRLKLINKVFSLIPQPRYIQKVPVYKCKDEAGLMKIYRDMINAKYEGAMVKSPNAPYLTSSIKSGSNLKSHDVLKLKMHYDDEYKIIGFKDGELGKDVGALIWILSTKDGHRFNATPKNMNYKERYDLYARFTNNPDIFAKYKDKMMTVEYQDLSKDKVPLRAKAIIIRDYED